MDCSKRGGETQAPSLSHALKIKAFFVGAQRLYFSHSLAATPPIWS